MDKETLEKGAIVNARTRVEIREVFLQVAIYCGVPIAGEAVQEMGI